MPFVLDMAQARGVVASINALAKKRGQPIVFCTVVDQETRAVIKSERLCSDMFVVSRPARGRAACVRARDRAMHGATSRSHVCGAHRRHELRARERRRRGPRDYRSANVVLIGVSRSGKTPTSLYLALQYGVFAANYPLADEELEAASYPPCCRTVSRSSTA